MNQSSQPDQSRVIGEMFDSANIAQPILSKDIPASLTPHNIHQPIPGSERPPAKNGFTTDNLQVPTPATDPIQGGDDE